MPPGPDEKCDPACQKVIINTGLMAHALDLLLMQRGLHPDVTVAARDLRAALQAHLSAYETLTKSGAISISEEHHAFKGCDQAATVMSWVDQVRRGERTMSAKGAVELMKDWTTAQIGYTAALMGSGKFSS